MPFHAGLKNPLEKLSNLGSNPLFAMGMQMMANSQKGPGYRPLMQGVGQAMQSSSRLGMQQQQLKMMQAQQQRAMEEQELRRKQEELKQAYLQKLMAGGGVPGGGAGAPGGGMAGPGGMGAPGGAGAPGGGVGVPGGGMMPPGGMGVTGGGMAQGMLRSGVDEYAKMAMESLLKNPAAKDAKKLAWLKTLSEEDRRLFQSGSDPSAVREFNFFAKLSPEEKQEYLLAKRANRPQNLGGSIGILDQRNPGQLLGEVQKTLPPEKEVGYLAQAAAATKGAGLTGETIAQAKIDLPNVEDQGNYLIGVLNQALNHPGKKAIVGASGALLPERGIIATEGRNFKAVMDQIKGKSFLEAFQMLKGGGHITEIEGEKATEAMARMDVSQTEASFDAAVREYIGVVEKGLKRARNRAAGVGLGAEAPNRSWELR